MTRRSIRSMSTLVGLAMLFAGLGPADTRAEQSWEPIDTEAWLSLSAPHGTQSLRPLAEDGQPVARSWILMAPGDTLSFDVRGQGQLRVQCRAVFDSDAAVRRFRLGVRLGNGVLRKLVRRARFESEWQLFTDSTPRRVSERDTWTSDLGGSGERVEVFLRERTSAPLLVRVLVKGDVERLVDASPGPQAASRRGEPDWSIDFDALTLGYVDNPYLVPKDEVSTTDVRDAWFWPITVGADLEWDRSLPFELDLDYRFDGQFFDDSLLDEKRHRIQSRQRWGDIEAGILGLSRLTLSQRWRARDRTFFSRGALEEFETISDLDPAVTISLGDRFDYRDLNLSAEWLSRPHDDWSLRLDAGWTLRDYTEDYEDQPSTDSLDQTRVALEIEVTRIIDDDTELGIEVGVDDWSYDEKFARLLDATELTSEATHLRRWPVTFRVARTPRVGFRLEVELGILTTRDLFEGYWDRSSVIGLTKLAWRSKRGWTTALRIRRSVTNYDIARVGYTTTGPIREKDSWRTSWEFEYPLRRWATGFATWSYQNLENNSRRFAYEQNEVLVGVQGEF